MEWLIILLNKFTSILLLPYWLVLFTLMHLIPVQWQPLCQILISQVFSYIRCTAFSSLTVFLQLTTLCICGHSCKFPICRFPTSYGVARDFVGLLFLLHLLTIASHYLDTTCRLSNELQFAQFGGHLQKVWPFRLYCILLFYMGYFQAH